MNDDTVIYLFLCVEFYAEMRIPNQHIIAYFSIKKVTLCSLTYRIQLQFLKHLYALLK